MNKIRNKLFVYIGVYIKGTVHLLKIHDYEKSINYSVNAKVPHICAGILNEKSAFSPATVVFEK